MRSLMNQVISEREKKHENKKRDVKFTNKMAHKQEVRMKKESQGMEQPKSDGPSMVESIFRPSNDTFKG
jgi:meiotically up-regulated gene 157 (Mug157) protein